MDNLKSLVGIEAPEFKGNLTGSATLEEGSTTPTAVTSTKNTTIASTEFVHNVVEELIDSAPETLDTLNELANALGKDKNFSTTMATELGKKANINDLKINDDGNGHLIIKGLLDD